jgi:hypothetical protein
MRLSEKVKEIIPLFIGIGISFFGYIILSLLGIK